MVPRLAAVGVVLVLGAGGLGVYLATAGQAHPAADRHRHAVLSSRVLKAQNVGIIDFGPADDGDAFTHDPNDHPLELQPAAGAVSFVAIARPEFSSGVPAWTDNQMADGTEIFVYTATGQCLSAARDPAAIRLVHCDLAQAAQRWRPLDAGIAHGQAFAKYKNAQTGRCLTAPLQPGPATLTECGQPRLKTQEIAFWWSA